MARIKRIISKTKLIIQNPKDIKYLQYSCIKPNGIVLIIHESKKLGASILLKHIAEELVRQGEDIYIISGSFGELNDEYNRIAPTQIVLTDTKLAHTLKKLRANGYSRLLINTAVCGDCVPIAKKSDYTVISFIHELAYVIRLLRVENETREMIKYSDETVFSTSVAKSEVLELLDINSDKIAIKPQGVYFTKPDKEKINLEKNKLIITYPILQEKAVIIGVGNTSERKGFDIFVETASKIPNLCFAWAGKKENYFNSVLATWDGQFPENFVYVGEMNKNELSGLYSLASILLMCSRKDTLPSIIFEALLFSVPVIGAIDSGGIIDVINDTNGKLTEKVSSDEFSDAISTLIKDIDRLKKNISEDTTYNNSFPNYVSYIREEFVILSGIREKK